jgi:hypothetical protein
MLKNFVKPFDTLRAALFIGDPTKLVLSLPK